MSWRAAWAIWHPVLKNCWTEHGASHSGGRGNQISKCEVSLSCIISSRPAKATYIVRPSQTNKGPNTKAKVHRTQENSFLTVAICDEMRTVQWQTMEGTRRTSLSRVGWQCWCTPYQPQHYTDLCRAGSLPHSRRRDFDGWGWMSQPLITWFFLWSSRDCPGTCSVTVLAWTPKAASFFFF